MEAQCPRHALTQRSAEYSCSARYLVNCLCVAGRLCALNAPANKYMNERVQLVRIVSVLPRDSNFFFCVLCVWALEMCICKNVAKESERAVHVPTQCG